MFLFVFCWGKKLNKTKNEKETQHEKAKDKEGPDQSTEEGGIDVRVHEVSGSPRPSFKVMYGSMGFRGLRDPQSNLFTSPFGFRFPWGLVQIYIQVHDISGSPETSFKLIDMQAHEISGSLKISFTFIFRPRGCKVPWDLLSNLFAGP